jgi:multidrug resistance efflux pump
MYLTEVKEGSEVRPGEPVFRIASIGELWIEAYAAKDYENLIHVGQTAYYTLDGHEFLASVAEIHDMSEVEQKDAAKGTEGTRPDSPHAGQLQIRVSIPSQEGVQIRPAMRTTVKVLLDR